MRAGGRGGSEAGGWDCGALTPRARRNGGTRRGPLGRTNSLKFNGELKSESDSILYFPLEAEAGTEPSPPVPHPWPFTRLPPGTNSSPSHPVSLLFPPSSPPRQTAPSPHSSAYASAARVAAINQDHTTASCLHGKLHGQSQPPRCCALAAVGRRPVPICTTALCWEIVRVVRAKPCDTSGTTPPPSPSPLLSRGAFPFFRGGWGW